METLTTPSKNTDRENGSVVATWVILGISWLCLLVPWFGLLGWIFAFVAFVLSIVVLSKGNTKTGVLLLVLSILGSLVVYGISWLILLIGIGAAANSNAVLPAAMGFLC